MLQAPRRPGHASSRLGGEEPKPLRGRCSELRRASRVRCGFAFSAALARVRQLPPCRAAASRGQNRSQLSYHRSRLRCLQLHMTLWMQMGYSLGVQMNRHP